MLVCIFHAGFPTQGLTHSSKFSVYHWATPPAPSQDCSNDTANKKYAIGFNHAFMKLYFMCIWVQMWVINCLLNKYWEKKWIPLGGFKRQVNYPHFQLDYKISAIHYKNNCFQCSPMAIIMRFWEICSTDTLLLNGWYLRKYYVISIAINCSLYKELMTKENTVKIYKINNKRMLRETEYVNVRAFQFPARNTESEWNQVDWQ